MTTSTSTWTSTITWSVSLSLVPTPGTGASLPVDIRSIRIMLDVLEDRAPIARTDAQELRFTLDSPGDLIDALADAKEAVWSALAIAGLEGFTIASATAVDHDDFDARVQEGDAPRYLSITETARELGVSKQRVSKMVKERQGLVADCYVGTAPGFRASTIERWKARRRA